jgi:hypothetical protein
MAHGEAEPGPGAAHGERRVREPEPAPMGRQLRRVCPDPSEPTASPEASATPDAAAPDADRPSVRACRSDRPGWAGAHRHGAVRPRRRANRRERPPDRWC